MASQRFSREHIELEWPDSFGDPRDPGLGVTSAEGLADWLEAKYEQMIVWTGYDPAAHHSQLLLFDVRVLPHGEADQGAYYDPNPPRRVNLKSQEHGRSWLRSRAFFEYLAHELAHDFTRWDEQYCRGLGITHDDQPRIEELVEHFKGRLVP